MRWASVTAIAYRRGPVTQSLPGPLCSPPRREEFLSNLWLLATVIYILPYLSNLYGKANGMDTSLWKNSVACVPGKMHENIHQNLVCNGEKLQTTKISFSSRMDKLLLYPTAISMNDLEVCIMIWKNIKNIRLSEKKPKL